MVPSDFTESSSEDQFFLVEMSAVYLKGLNGIRAIAALAVIHAHISVRLTDFGLLELPHSDLAGFGVTIFFALSGFLITYLLINELDNTGNIDIRKFYIRRILRIWPLYFLYLLLNSFFVYGFTSDFDFDKLIYYLMFLPNIPYLFDAQFPNAGHYWSLGVEEQFYLFWPVFVLFSGRSLLKNLFIFIGAFLVLKVWANLYFGGYSSEYTFLYITRFDCMAIGALGAWPYKWHPVPATYLTHPVVQFIAWSAIVLTAFNKFHFFSVIDHEIMSMVTVCLILGQIMQNRKKPLFNLETKVLDFLGKISFGLYVYHPMLIFLLSKSIHFEQDSWVNAGVTYLLVLLVSITIAHLSYQYIEMPFLWLKRKFTVVKSVSSLSVQT